MSEVQVPKNQPVKLTMTHYRQQQHSHEAFINWIVQDHLPLAIPVFEKYGLTEYSLFITPSSLNDSLKQAIGESCPTWDFADFDCFIEYMLPSVETVMKIMSDPDWQIAIKDEDKWVDMPKALISVGYSTGNLLNKDPAISLSEHMKLGK
ncbi:Dimeric alpha-beta barrel [Penicillium verhagenii]|uniref:Dimeric alpha-beta barrel n=1 Tax=Penicillium verhagenii TaxID=1562060 RepID=UPI0025456BED|nr:Dimeric alpha-beta barrel [Penicillium verhagenii]KAJ5915682.1 Dimeric alpha-beta barrel [Penicillium verhagenii]